MLGRTDSRTRALFLLLAFVIVAGSLGVRLGYWQVVRRDELAAMAVRQSSTRYEIPSRRGSIYDRSGTVVLATSVSRDRLAANPKLLTPERRAEVAARLVELIGLTGDDADNLTARMTSDREYVVLAREIDPSISDRIRELSAGDAPELSGLLLEPQSVRLYPQAGGAPRTTLAAHLLGFVNRDGVGQYGVEQYYQDDLAGLATVVAAQHDASGNAVPESSTVIEPGYPGQNLTLTVDASLQVAVEQELLSAWIADRAKRVSAVVMDPYTGEVYAYASYPSYDANQYQALAADDPGVFVDPIVVDGLRARLGVQDAHRDGGAGQRGRQAEDHAHRLRDPPRRQRTRARRRRRPQGDGPHDVRECGRVLAQRRRGEGRAEARPDDRRLRRAAVPDVAPDGLRLADGDRRRERGRRDRP